LLVLAPAALVAKQPISLGVLLVMTGRGDLSGRRVRIWKFLAIASPAARCSVAWRFLREYQRNRVLTFLTREHPLGRLPHHPEPHRARLGGVWARATPGHAAHLQFLPRPRPTSSSDVRGGVRLVGPCC